jgi:hypothetical protein
MKHSTTPLVTLDQGALPRVLHVRARVPRQGQRFIATTCPALIGYVEKYYPKLVGALAPIAGWVFAAGHPIRGSGWCFHPNAVNMVAVCGFVIAVTGLSGLVCVALGLAQLLAGRKGT